MKTLLGILVPIAIVCGATAEAQPASVSLGPAAAGTREIGFSYAGWSFLDERVAPAGAARYTYNLTPDFGIEGGVDIGSDRGRAFAAASVQVRLMRPRQPFEPGGRFVTVGVVHGARDESPAPRTWGRSVGIGALYPVTGDVAVRFDGQLLIFDRSHGGFRVALTIVKGKG